MRKQIKTLAVVLVLALTVPTTVPMISNVTTVEAAKKKTTTKKKTNTTKKKIVKKAKLSVGVMAIPKGKPKAGEEINFDWNEKYPKGFKFPEYAEPTRLYDNIKITNKKKGAKYTFTTSNKKIATVDSKGWVTGMKEGLTTITCKEKYKGKTKKVGTCKIAVMKSKVFCNDVSGYGYPMTPVENNGIVGMYYRNLSATYEYKSNSKDFKLYEKGGKEYYKCTKAGTYKITAYEKYQGKKIKIGNFDVKIIAPSIIYIDSISQEVASNPYAKVNDIVDMNSQLWFMNPNSKYELRVKEGQNDIASFDFVKGPRDPEDEFYDNLGKNDLKILKEGVVTIELLENGKLVSSKELNCVPSETIEDFEIMELDDETEEYKVVKDIKFSTYGYMTVFFKVIADNDNKVGLKEGNIGLGLTDRIKVFPSSDEKLIIDEVSNNLEDTDMEYLSLNSETPGKYVITVTCGDITKNIDVIVSDVIVSEEETEE